FEINLWFSGWILENPVLFDQDGR
ncbi:hypothetical protein THAOC_12885, partial [Thalassiosira oceanica]